MNSLKDIGHKVLHKTLQNINRAVAPNSNKRNFALDKQREFYFKLKTSEQNAPTPVQRMQDHGGVGKLNGDGTYDVFLITHNPPVGIPSIKMSNTDLFGKKRDQYLVGPFKINENDISFSGVSKSLIAPQVFTKSNISQKDENMLLAMEGFFNGSLDRENIRMAFMSAQKLTVDVAKQLGEIILQY